MQVSAFSSPLNSEDAEDADLVLVDVLTPTFLFPSTIHHKDLVKECVDRLGVKSEKSIKLYYLIDTETREQQNHRMAVLIQDTKLSLPYIEELAVDNDLLQDRLGTSLQAFATAHEALQVAKAELELEKKKRKAAEAKVKELQQLLLVQKRGTV